MRWIVPAAIAMLSFAPAPASAASPPGSTARPPSPAGKSEQRLTELVAAVRSADYRGDRAALAKLDEELGALDAGRLNDYRDYWRGFALWRRVLNGFNEKPAPDDLAADAEKAISRFKAALAVHPDWIEAQLAMVGLWGNQIYLAGKDADKRKAILAEAGPTFKFVMANAGDNPRALWIRGGMEGWAPPPTGGDLGKAAATLRYGVECAWREAAAHPNPPGWFPTWGGPENLMNLAYIYSNAKTPDRATALAYAQGAVTAVPEWHFVRDILIPRIEALPAGPAPEAPPPPPTPTPAP
jgi:hypothetical protein